MTLDGISPEDFDKLDDDADTSKAEDEAMAQALADMQDDEDSLPLLRLAFIGSYAVENSRKNSFQHGIARVEAQTLEEALGRIYLDVSADFKDKEGWSAPHIIMDGDPLVIVPGLRYPITRPPAREDEDEDEVEVDDESERDV